MTRCPRQPTLAKVIAEAISSKGLEQIALNMRAVGLAVRSGSDAIYVLASQRLFLICHEQVMQQLFLRP